ncbi:MAG: RtcB family protein [Chloroflexota bacterium]
MKPQQLAKLGVPRGEARKLAGKAVKAAKQARLDKQEVPERIRALLVDPEAFIDDEIFGTLAQYIAEQKAAQALYVPRTENAPFQVWGDIDPKSLEQMKHASELPVAVRGAIMPDAHLGYGLPIGGVLAVRNAVIPYAVGVDIACRMKMTVLDMPANVIEGQEGRLINALEQETRFGMGANFKRPRDHEVMDADWSVTDVTNRLKDKAWKQLGTSGSGNHFVEFGTLDVLHDGLDLAQGTYLALLSHSGSRGAGAAVAGHYSKLAMDLRAELPKHLKHLSWLDLDTEPGQEYWAAMNLMGEYAAANHACIHRHVLKALGAKPLLQIENHHNFAWAEEHDDETVIVHRKGATPADDGVLGIIPGSMATPAFVVRGRGNEASLNSASHGAGRQMSRRAAKERFTWSEAKKFLAQRNVKLLSAGLDEVPMAYKDINEVMAAQTDLVEIMARFKPRLVKMAPEGEKPED